MAHYINNGAPINEYTEEDKEAVPELCLAKIVLYFRRNTGVIAWIIVFEIIGAVIGLTTNIDSEWYTNLEKSPLDPPPALFGVAWPILYFLLAIAAYQIFYAEEKDPKKYELIGPFVIQQLLNWTWNFVFFTLENAIVALIMVSIIGTLVGFIVFSLAKLRAWEFYLVLPYFLWLIFASHLNYYIVSNNCFN